ncbi:hypothetical protein Tco_0127307 [Tanacetum coccineum]
MAKEIWENVELLMQGSGLIEQQKKETLFDQYERFRANGNEPIHDYFVRFHKLINDMKITKMEIPAHQRNTKFVNNLPLYWSKYVTIVKNSKDISIVSYVDLCTHLKSYEQHAMKTLSKMNQTSRNTDLLTYILSGFQKQFPPTNNQLRTSTNPMTQATIQAGQITTESVQQRAPGNKGKHVATGSQGKVLKRKAILDAKAEAFLAEVKCTTPYAEPLAITTTTAFEVSHEDAYDSDFEEAPHAAAAFMANLMQTGPSTRQGTCNDTDFHSELCRPTLYLGDVIVDPIHTSLRVYDSEETLVQAEVSRINIYELDKEYDQCVIDKKSLEIENKNLLIQNECFLAESVSKDICSVVLTSDIAVPMSVEPRSNCVKDHSRNLELEAEILKVKQLLVEKEKRCSFIKTKYQELELNFQKYKECFENPQLKAQIGNINKVSANPNLSTLEFQALETENTEFKEELTTVRIKSDSLRDENVSIKKRYQDLYKSKAESNSNVSSRATVPKKPKIWKATGKIFASVGSKWRPTGRKFTLGDTCPLTMITKPEVVPLEKSGSVSNSEPSNNVIVTPRFSKKPLTSYKRKDRKLKDISTGSPPNTETKVVNDPVNVNDLSTNQLDPNKKLGIRCSKFYSILSFLMHVIQRKNVTTAQTMTTAL